MKVPFAVPARAHQPFDVVAFGVNSVDLVAVVAVHPAPDSKQPLVDARRLPGGEMATAAVTCARLGWRARYVGSFGDDEFGAFSREALVREEVDVQACRTVPGSANQFAVILVVPATAERTVLWKRDPALAMNAADVPRAAVTSGRLLLVDAHDADAAAEAARLAREQGIPTIVDIDAVGSGTDELLRHIDVIIAAGSIPTALTGCPDLGRALERMARDCCAAVVCATLGAEGSLARASGREIRTPPFPVDCVDTTGAGDAFRGGFAAACLGGRELEDVLRYANAVAALNCRHLGARGGLPTADEVERLL